MNNPAAGAPGAISGKDPNQQRKARLMMIAIVAVFVLPFLVLPLFSSPERVGKTNKGLLIQPHIALSELALVDDQQQAVGESHLEKRWTLLYVIPQACDDACVLARNNALFAMRQVRLSLDRSVNRVQHLLVFTAEVDGNLSTLLRQEFSGMKQVRGSQRVLETALYSRVQANYPAGSVFLMSPDGYIFMAYPTFVDEHESVLRARDMRADLKKSIKGDRNFQ